MKTYLGLAHNVVSVKSTSHRLSHDLSQINSFVWERAVTGTGDALDPRETADAVLELARN